MSDLSNSERRLIGALDRLDYTVERAATGMARLRQVSGDASHMAAASPTADRRAGNRQLSDDVAALHDRQSATLDTMRERLDEAHERLEGAGEHMSRLAAANDGLAAANRDLIAAADAGQASPDAARAALEAEIEALRAARAAEIAQMGEILDALDRMLGTPAPAPRKVPHDDHGGHNEHDAQAVERGQAATSASVSASVSTATAVVAPTEVVKDVPARDAGGGDATSPDHADPRLPEGGPHELTVERDELPDDDVSLFGGVYDDDEDADLDPDDPEDLKGDRR